MTEKSLKRVFYYFGLCFRISYKYVELLRYGELKMLRIPSALQSQFEECLRNKAIPKETHGLYRKWLRYYLDFCQKYDFPDAQRESLPPFLGKLAEKKQTKEQLEQAAHTIALYYESLDHKGPTDKFPPHPKSGRKRDAPFTGAKSLSRAPWQKEPGPAGAPRIADRGPWVSETTATYTVSPEGKAPGQPPLNRSCRNRFGKNNKKTSAAMRIIPPCDTCY
jgi:hypothetical protein